MARSKKNSKTCDHARHVTETYIALKYLPSRRCGRCDVGGPPPWMSKSARFAGVMDKSAGNIVQGPPTGGLPMPVSSELKGVGDLQVPSVPASELTGVADLHASVPPCVAKAGEGACKTFRYIGKVALVACIAVDGYRLGIAIFDDVKHKRKVPKKTIHTSASIAGGIGGGILGATAGSAVGVMIGRSIGDLFGGHAAFPGSVVGYLIGVVAGGVAGGVVVSRKAEEIADKVIAKYCSDTDDSDEDDESTV